MLKPSDRFNNLSKLYKKRLIPADQYEKEIPYVYEEAMERNLILQKISQYYDIDRKLETVYGRFSNVLNYHSTDGRALSLRLIKKKDEGLYESECQDMKQKNIATILNRRSFDEEDVICYLSPYIQYNLKQVITSEVFKTSKQSSMILPKWLKDIASGLEYIHSKRFAHTNITANNILIQDSLIATITDFHFLNTSMKASNRIGVKYSHRPPESFRNADGTSSIDCTKVDVWSLGILAVNIFTGLSLEKKLPDDVIYWSKDVYPQIFEVLKKKKFNKLHGKYLKYPSPSNILKSARSFAAFCFQFDPSKRPSVKDLLGHDLMNQSGFLPAKENMWHKKAHWKTIEKEISLLKDYQVSQEDLDGVLGVEPSPYLENLNNSNTMEKTISPARKIKCKFEGQNHNILEISGVKKELISQVTDAKEIPPNSLSGDAEKNILILDDDITYEEERIHEPKLEDKYTDNKSEGDEGDRLADLLLSITKIQQPNKNVENTENLKNMLILDDDITYEEERIHEPKQEDKYTEIKSEGEYLTDLLLSISKFQPNKHDENAEIFKDTENIRTSLEIEDQEDADYFPIASNTETYSEDDHLADLLISLSEFNFHSTNDEEENISLVDENQNENVPAEKNTTKQQNKIKSKFEIRDSAKDIITEEITMPQMQQCSPEDEIENKISVMDFQKENNAEKCSSYWNLEVGVYLLNLFIDSNSSNGMLHPENYLFNLVQKL